MVTDPEALSPEEKWHPGGETAVYGIVGDPVKHSLSPWMHRLFAAQRGLDTVYVPFPVRTAALPKALEGLAAAGVHGLNITVPHKEAVLSLVDELSPEARQIGAVNTIHFTAGRSFGSNTDALGFQRALERGVGSDWRAAPVLVIGAGGAARAIVYALGSAGCPAIYVANRHPDRAERLAGEFARFPLHPLPLERKSLARILPQVGLLVNTSALGLHGESHPELDLECLSSHGKVYDIVYNPLETPLLRTARQCGRDAMDGLGMLVEQGAESFRIWTGVLPQTQLVEDTLRRWLQTRNKLL
ncbi:shikimate dehydrogenase [Acidithiobacillus sp. M4-SHS-6]|uniref:shikimate dehydrogenase n=1 Tax=Acidithiobacillus sp. M4-SHS-6 TaxID=3383024 RepID=UPI0039BE4C45